MKWLINLACVSTLLVMAFAKGNTKIKRATDYRIDLLVDSLPANWYVKYSDTLITFVCRDSVYRVWNNKINADVRSLERTQTEEQKMEALKKEGKKKEGAYLSFRLMKKWTDVEIKKANASNQKIYKQMKALPKKHKIEHLYDDFASHKGTPTYTPKVEDDKKKIAAYVAEKATLEKKIVKFPDYCTSFYSVYSDKRVGMENEYEDIYPAKISAQAYHIMNLVDEIWDCNSKTETKEK